MSIGVLALIVGLVCAVATAIAPPDDRKPEATPDYHKIYEAITPHEI